MSELKWKTLEWVYNIHLSSSFSVLLIYILSFLPLVSFFSLFFDCASLSFFFSLSKFFSFSRLSSSPPLVRGFLCESKVVLNSFLLLFLFFCISFVTFLPFLLSFRFSASQTWRELRERLVLTWFLPHSLLFVSVSLLFLLFSSFSSFFLFPFLKFHLSFLSVSFFFHSYSFQTRLGSSFVPAEYLRPTPLTQYSCDHLLSFFQFRFTKYSNLWFQATLNSILNLGKFPTLKRNGVFSAMISI